MLEVLAGGESQPARAYARQSGGGWLVDPSAGEYSAGLSILLLAVLPIAAVTHVDLRICVVATEWQQQPPTPSMVSV